MNVIAMVIQLSTRGTVDSDNWFLRLPDRAMPRSYHLSDNGWTPLSQNPGQKVMISYPHAIYKNTNRPLAMYHTRQGSSGSQKCGSNPLWISIWNMCEDISIADDFDVRLGVVSGGVFLLIRPAETKPMSPDISRGFEQFQCCLAFLAWSCFFFFLILITLRCDWLRWKSALGHIDSRFDLKSAFRAWSWTCTRTISPVDLKSAFASMEGTLQYDQVLAQFLIESAFSAKD